ncbi:hypothetical protein X801_05490, partial [Opisthorchis viverrini]
MLTSDAFTAAMENLSKNRGSPGEWFAHKADYREPTRHPRIRPESVGIVERNQPHISMAALAGFEDRPHSKFQSYEEFGIVPRDYTDQPIIRRVRTFEAELIAKKSQSQSDRWHDFEGNQTYQAPRPPPRIGAGSDGKPRGIASAESREVALRATGEAAKELLSHDKLPPEPVRSGFAAMSEEVRENAYRNQKGLIGGLIGGKSDELSSITLVGVEAPAPRRLHYEAVEYALKNRDQQVASCKRRQLFYSQWTKCYKIKTSVFGCGTQQGVSSIGTSTMHLIGGRTLGHKGKKTDDRSNDNMASEDAE